MAKKANIQVPSPSALDRARMTAENEKAENISAQQQMRQETTPLSDALKKEIGSIKTADVRVTRTFTLSTDTEKRLKRAADMLGTNKSALLERAFNEWFNVVEKEFANT